MPAPNLTRDLLEELSQLAANATAAELATYATTKQEECSRSRSHPGHSVKCDMAETPITGYRERGT